MVRCAPQQRHLVAMCVNTLVRLASGQIYPQRHLVAKCVTNSVRLTSGQMYPPETSGGQVCYYFGQADLWADLPLGRDIFWPSVTLLHHCVRLTFGQIYPQMRLWVRLTLGQMCPWAGTSCGQV